MSKEELQRMKELYKAEALSKVREKIVDAMASYEAESIPYLIECADGELLASNREHILDKISQIRGIPKS